MHKLKNVFQASFVLLWLQLYRVRMDTYIMPSSLYFHNRKCVCLVKLHFTYFLFLFHFCTKHHSLSRHMGFLNVSE